jgi:phosphate:Na+ symporter
VTSPLDPLPIAAGIAGGLALFLFGMGLLADGLKAVAGDRMRGILAHLTANRFIGALTGAFVTAVVQSSSVTTVLLVGFISAGLMTLPQSVGVIMGANIGSTVTAQIIAFKIADQALLIVAAGFALFALGRRETVTQAGTAILGIGLVFFGMAVMSEAVAPLRGYPPFVDALIHLQNPVLGILVGAAFTALIQSSAATTGLVIVLAGQGLITLSAGIAVVLGANIGTCVTALFAAIGRPREAVRAAAVHVIFNIAGVILWFGFIGQLAALATAVSPVAEGLQGAAKRAAETPRQIANAHTAFNVCNTLIFIWFTGPIARLVQWLIPEKRPVAGGLVRPRYLDDLLLDTPSMALHAAHLELGELGTRVQAMLAAILPAVLTGSRARLHEVARMDAGVDTLHGEMIAYLRRLGLRALATEEGDELVRLIEVANNFENIGDIIETDLVTLGNRRLEERISISDSTAHVIGEFHRAVTEALDTAIDAAATGDEQAALRVIAMKPSINTLADEASRRGAHRLVSQEPARLRAYTREMEMIEKLKRIYYFAKRIAKTVVPHGEEEAG